MANFSTKLKFAVILVIIAVLAGGFWLFRDEILGVDGQTVPTSVREQSVTRSKNKQSAMESGQETKDGDKKAVDAGESGRSRDFRLSKSDGLAMIRDGNFFTTVDVLDLQPAEPSNEFTVGQRVFAYAAIHAPSDETVRISWYDSVGELILPSSYLDVKSNVGEVGYRVYTYRIFRDTGQYTVAVYNNAGTKLSEYAFTVE